MANRGVHGDTYWDPLGASDSLPLAAEFELLAASFTDHASGPTTRCARRGSRARQRRDQHTAADDHPWRDW